MPTIIDILKTAMAPASARTAHFCAIVDEHLAGLPDDAARLAHLHKQKAKWITLYERWAQAVDSGRLTVKLGDASAWDYQLTLAAITERIGRYERAGVAA